MKTLIVGGGNLGHVMASVISNKGYEVAILSRSPEKWDNNIKVRDNFGKIYEGNINVIKKLDTHLLEYDNILLCLPGNAIEQNLTDLQPYISKTCNVGSVFSSTGFFWIAKKVLGENSNLYGFQRVPYMSKILEYGKSSEITGYKKEHKLFFSTSSENKNKLKSFYNEILNIDITEVQNYLEVSLTNSNPLLHTARLFGLLSDYSIDVKYKNHFSFYKGWTNKDSQLLVEMDSELQTIISGLSLPKEYFPTVMSHYETSNIQELTDKINSIPAFQSVMLPMIETDKGFIPNLSHRFFVEDIPFGLVIIKSIAILLNVKTPNIDKVLFHFQKIMDKEFISYDNKKGKNYSESASILNFGIDGLSKLLVL